MSTPSRYYPRQTSEDVLDWLLGSPAPESAPAPEPAPEEPFVPMMAEEEQATQEVPVKLDRSSPYYKACPRCGGTGRYYARSQYGSVCFACKGVGGSMMRTTEGERAKGRARALAREEAARQSRWEAFAAEHPIGAAEILAGEERGFQFAKSLGEAVRKYGYLTTAQLSALGSIVAKRAEREAEKARTAEQVAKAAPFITAPILAAFEAARNSGLKNPVLRFEGFAVSMAKATSSNAGALYVKDGATYLGKIVGSTWRPSWDGKQRKDLGARIAEVLSNPVESAIRYGKESGTCSCCGRTLTDPASIAAGIGPICAEGWGF